MWSNPVFPRAAARRWCGALLGLLLGAAPVLRSAPAGATELAAALARFRADAPPGWSYLQTTTASGRSTVERCDAARPPWERWSLVEKDGRPPDAGELQSYLEARSRRSRGGTAPKLAEQLDLSTVEPGPSDDTRATFRCRLKSAENGDQTAAYLRAEVVLHRATATIESIELHAPAPFSPTFGVRISSFRTRLTYSLPAGETPSLPLRVDTRIQGTAFWLKSLDAEMSVVFTGYLRATKPPPRKP